MLKIIIGSIIVIAAIVAFIICYVKTPTNLRGWYGKMFLVLGLFSLIGGIILILAGCGLF